MSQLCDKLDPSVGQDPSVDQYVCNVGMASGVHWGFSDLNEKPLRYLYFVWPLIISYDVQLSDKSTILTRQCSTQRAQMFRCVFVKCENDNHA